MKLSIILLMFFAFNAQSKEWQSLKSKLDSTTGKYGFVDSTDHYVIQPKYDQVREFESEYTSVRMDALWGVIDTQGHYILEPKFNQLSAVYRGHFLEGGDTMKFRSINGKVKYKYLYIPGPFQQINSQFKNDPEARKLEDYELFVKVLEIKQCHYYKLYRPYNWIAIQLGKYAKMTIEFVLNNSDQITNWIENDKQFENDFKEGKIGCCGYGTYRW